MEVLHQHVQLRLCVWRGLCVERGCVQLGPCAERGC